LKTGQTLNSVEADPVSLDTETILTNSDCRLAYQDWQAIAAS